MTMLTHSGGPIERPRYPLAKQDTVETDAADARRAKIKQFCMCAFTVLLAVSILAGGIALKGAVYLSRINFHH